MSLLASIDEVFQSSQMDHADHPTLPGRFSFTNRIIECLLIFSLCHFLSYEGAAMTIPESKIAAQLYIFGGDAVKAGEPLNGYLKVAHDAGYQLVQGWLSYFESEELAVKLDGYLAAHQLSMPCAYAGGGMHTREAGDQAIHTILSQARIASRHGLKIIVHNPDPIGRKKTDEELAIQAQNLNRLGTELSKLGLQLAVHQHDVEMQDGACEWYHILEHTDPAKVFFCLDTHWVLRGKQDPCRLLESAGKRVVDLHLRNSKDGIWMEDFGLGDLDYQKIQAILERIDYQGYYTVELAYDPQTQVTRSLEENLRRSLGFVLNTFR
ncbi:MAG: TIM barrel protein [Candidatus Omnitrophica bacterium]|nr:TIM barrel protein [Candidatus Omnitrophota bacterium]